MTIELIRKKTEGKAVYGQVTVPFLNGQTQIYPTLENKDFLIPEGTYPLKMTWSPKFKRNMPEICDVPVTNDAGVIGVPDGRQQSASGGESGVGPSTLSNDKVVSSCTEGRTRVGIRIHRGSRPEHSEGCVLANELGVEGIRVFIDSFNKWYDEELSIRIKSEPV